MYPTPHLEKLTALLRSDKLPECDRAGVEEAIRRYHQWIADIEALPVTNPEDIDALLLLLNDYKRHIDLNLIFDSEADFLYRQKGQLKLDNSIIEEFLPRIVARAIPQLQDGTFELGPRQCYATVYFSSGITNPLDGGGLHVKAKDQDFAIAKKLFLKTSHDADFGNSETNITHLGYIVAECKTNLDKTMFQEAAATANDLRRAVPSSKYYLLCEWLDMTPVSTAPTDIEEVIIMRQAKRLPSNVRKSFSSRDGRIAARAAFEHYLVTNPFQKPPFTRLLNHILAVVQDVDPEEDDVLRDGYF